LNPKDTSGGAKANRVTIVEAPPGEKGWEPERVNPNLDVN